MADVGVVIGTYGDEDFWRVFATRAAYSAVNRQRVEPEDVIWAHGDTLQEARNRGADQLTTEWLIFLDADDELDPNYVWAMMGAQGDIRRPSTLGIQDGVEDDYPVMIQKRPLYDGNYIVIGAMCRRDLFMDVGGFRDLPCLEDWDLWIRMSLAGATVSEVPDAIYRVHVNPNGRNSQEKVHHDTYLEIRKRYFDVRGELQ